MTTFSALARATLAGAATGSRSMSAIAACAVTGPPATNRVDAWLHRSAGRRRSIVLSAAGEVIGDKLPQAPSRTDAAGLGARVALGSVAAGVLAARRGEPVRLAAVVGLAAAAATSFGGVRARAVAADRFGSDLPGSLVEDALAFGLAGTAARLP